MKIRSKIIECDVPLSNGRYYPHFVVNDALSKLQKIHQEHIYGRIKPQVEHADKPLDVKDISHEVRTLWWDGNVLWGEFDILPTPKGKILQEILEKTPSEDCIGLTSSGEVVYDNDNKVYVVKELDILAMDYFGPTKVKRKEK